MKTLQKYIKEKLVINQQVDEKLLINKNYKNIEDKIKIGDRFNFVNAAGTQRDLHGILNNINLSYFYKDDKHIKAKRNLWGGELMIIIEYLPIYLLDIKLYEISSVNNKVEMTLTNDAPIFKEIFGDGDFVDFIYYKRNDFTMSFEIAFNRDGKTYRIDFIADDLEKTNVHEKLAINKDYIYDETIGDILYCNGGYMGVSEHIKLLTSFINEKYYKSIKKWCRNLEHRDAGKLMMVIESFPSYIIDLNLIDNTDEIIEIKNTKVIQQAFTEDIKMTISKSHGNYYFGLSCPSRNIKSDVVICAFKK